MKLTHLSLKWSISRGRDTYGYNTATLTDGNTDQRYRCNGGGYDMVGTVFGAWLEAKYQARLAALDTTKFYGITRRNDGSVYLDGACGLDSMTRLAAAIGLEVQRLANRKGHTEGYIICDTTLAN